MFTLLLEETDLTVIIIKTKIHGTYTKHPLTHYCKHAIQFWMIQKHITELLCIDLKKTNLFIFKIVGIRFQYCSIHVCKLCNFSNNLPVWVQNLICFTPTVISLLASNGFHLMTNILSLCPLQNKNQKIIRISVNYFHLFKGLIRVYSIFCQQLYIRFNAFSINQGGN